MRVPLVYWGGRGPVGKERGDDFYSTESARSDSIGLGGSRDNSDNEDQEASDSEASIFSPHLYRHLGLHRQLIYSLQGNEAAEAGSKIHSVRSRFGT